MLCRALVLVALSLFVAASEGAVCTDADFEYSKKMKPPCTTVGELQSNETMDPVERDKRICGDKGCIDAIKDQYYNGPDCTSKYSSASSRSFYMDKFNALRSRCEKVGIDIGQLKALPPSTTPKRAVSSASGSGSGATPTVRAPRSTTSAPSTSPTSTPPPFRSASPTPTTSAARSEGNVAWQTVRGLLVVVGCVFSLAL